MVTHSPGDYQTIWASAAPVSSVSVSSNLVVGIYVKFLTSGKLYGIRAYLTASGGLRHTGWVAKDGQTQFIDAVAFTGFHKNPTVTGWHGAFLKRVIEVTAGDTYVLTTQFNFSPYGLMVAAHSPDSDTTIGNFLIPMDTGSRPNGATQSSLALSLPTSIGAAKPAIDVLFR